ncbi:MAG: hypothetical protein SGJ20_13640 [Planctomycetota bacterium]|nr:hypothetical protein [Planctomycetota bacterium]
MNSVQRLTFIWSGWSIAISVLVLAVTATLCVVAWRRSGYRRDYGLLELVRFAAVLLVVILYNQPEWVEEFRPEEKPTIAVLLDQSASMDTRDVVAREASSAPLVTRREAIAPLLQESFWKSVEGRLNVVIQPISPIKKAPSAGGAKTDAAAKSDTAKSITENGTAADATAATPAAPATIGTNLNEPLTNAPKRLKNLRGVVLASDGDWNEGGAPVLAAAALRLKDVPVFVVPVGSTQRLPDIELLSLDTPTFGIVGKSVRVAFTVESSLPREHATTVTLKTSDGETLTKEVRIAPMGRTTDWLLWKPKTVGDFTLTLDIPKHADELLPDNNSLTTPIAIREEKLRVLLVESIPRWEYRYLRNALSRDPGVEVSCLLFHPGLSKTGGGNKDYIKSFPKGLEELSKYDVVFIGDVGVAEGQLTIEDCRLLKGLVEHQASGLVFMPGFQGNQTTLLQTDLDDICPVIVDPSQPEGWGSRTPCHFELTELGRRSLLTKLADTQEDNMEVWESLPGFQWYAPVLRAKAGSEVLAVHKEVSNQYGRLPLLATRTFGAGKVLYMGTDGAWRWRKGVEDKYHYLFWGQVVRWMAYRRNMAKGETMRMYYSPEQPQVQQTVALSANVMERSGEPLQKGDVTARIVAPSGKTETVRFTSAGDEWGAFTSRFTPTEPGRYAVTLQCQQAGGTLETNVFVQGVAAEGIGKSARPEVLEEIARVTRGQSIRFDQLEKVLQQIAALPDPEPSVRRMQLWSHPVLAGTLIVLLGIFWIGRKSIGLI